MLLRTFLFFLLSLGGTAFGGVHTVWLGWDQSPPDENVMGYVVQYGTTHGLYTNIDLSIYPDGDLLTGLQEGATYYFVVYAIDAEGNTSPLSQELVYTVPIPEPVNLQTQVYPDGNGVPFAMTITGTNSILTDWELDSSPDLVNWTYVTGDHGIDIYQIVYFTDATQMFYRLLDN